MAQKFANAARAVLSAGIASGDTTVTIVSGGSLFPEISSPDFARAVLQDISGIEIVLITAHTASADSFTITRAQEGTTARSFDAGSIFGIRVTAADMDEALDDVNLASEVTGTLPVANGGTGATSLTANNVVLGNGTSAVQVVAPGTSGNVLTSNGTTWTSAAAAVTLNGTQTLTNKIISADDNTLSGVAPSSFVLSNGGGNIDGAAAQKAIPTGVVVGTTDTQTLTNKRVTPRSTDIASATTVTPTADTADQYEVTALAAGATIATPSGTPTDGQKLILRIKDNGTARALTWTTTSGAYRAVGVTLPTTTVVNKVVYVGCVYNSQDVFWDVLAVAQLP